MNRTQVFHSAIYALVAVVLVFALGMMTFFTLEPSVGHSQEEFLVTQTITDEVSFLVAPANVTMSGSIQGLTGGYATGTTMAVVSTNDPQGYTMTLGFASATAMIRVNSTSTINNYTPATINVPDYTWVNNSAGGASEFGYSVRASSTGEVNASFMNDNSSACNTGSTESDDRCWLNPSTTAKTIMSTAAPVAYSTSTIKFKVAVPSNPSPVIASGIYIATGTLTVTGNP